MAHGSISGSPGTRHDPTRRGAKVIAQQAPWVKRIEAGKGAWMQSAV